MVKVRSGEWVILSMALVACVLPVFSGCDGDDDDNGLNGTPNQPGANEVWMVNLSFVPETLTVASGTEVTWSNRDAETHTVRSGVPGAPTANFSSGNLGVGGTFSFVFTDTTDTGPDTIPYFCELHNEMTGAIIVEPE